MPKPIDFSLVLACYREEEIFWPSVQQIIKTLNRSDLEYEIIFVEDKSPDNTAKLVAQACKMYPKICRAIFHEVNRGRGTTVADGIKAAKGGIVGYIDIDCEVSPVYIPEAVEMILEKKADAVVGKRIYHTSFSGIFRELMSVGYKKISQTLLNTNDIDTESGYKFFDRRKIVPILKYANHPHWFWDTQIVVYSLKNGLRVKSLPVLFLRKPEKTSTVKIWRDTIDYLLNIVKLYWRFKK